MIPGSLSALVAFWEFTFYSDSRCERGNTWKYLMEHEERCGREWRTGRNAGALFLVYIDGGGVLDLDLWRGKGERRTKEYIDWSGWCKCRAVYPDRFRL